MNHSDEDQTLAESDQTFADADQRASDLDQTFAGRGTAQGNGADDLAHARSRRARGQSALERDRTTRSRLETARMRDEAADRRDRVAADRDAAALARDQLAAALDAEIERLESGGRPQSVGLDVLVRAAGDRKRAAASRARAAAQREAAAHDRQLAARDRGQAALDRREAAVALTLEGIDHLTGTMRRGVGLGAIQREMDRTRRSGEPLVVAFVDVDGLKRVNDEISHLAGDEILRRVAGAIIENLRSYDLITRFGGDEFLCSLTGQKTPGARERFEQISAGLSAGSGPTIAVGLAERRGDDTLEQLIQRADAAMRAGRH